MGTPEGKNIGLAGGKYVVIEGTDGAGKGTIIGMLRADYLKDWVFTREPGDDSDRVEAYRKLLLGIYADEPDYESEMDTFIAARRYTIKDVVNPALARGDNVLSDRCFLSSLAYQGARGGLGPDYVLDENMKRVLHYCNTPKHLPHLIILLSCPPEVGRARMDARKAALTGFDREPIEVQNRTYEGYHEAAAMINEIRSGTVVTVDATRSLMEVFEDVLAVLAERKIL
jgi:dTMP kinase